MPVGGKRSSRRLLTIKECNEREPRQRNHSDRRIEMWENESPAPSSDHTTLQARRTKLHNRRRSRTRTRITRVLRVLMPRRTFNSSRHAERSSAFCRIFPTVARDAPRFRRTHRVVPLICTSLALSAFKIRQAYT